MSDRARDRLLRAAVLAWPRRRRRADGAALLGVARDLVDAGAPAWREAAGLAGAGAAARFGDLARALAAAPWAAALALLAPALAAAVTGLALALVGGWSPFVAREGRAPWALLALAVGLLAATVARRPWLATALAVAGAGGLLALLLEGRTALAWAEVGGVAIDAEAVAIPALALIAIAAPTLRRAHPAAGARAVPLAAALGALALLGAGGLLALMVPAAVAWATARPERGRRKAPC